MGEVLDVLWKRQSDWSIIEPVILFSRLVKIIFVLLHMIGPGLIFVFHAIYNNLWLVVLLNSMKYIHYHAR